MGMPFSDPVAGGGGDLVIQQLQSPNFVAGSEGWQIAQNGTAQFADVTITGGSLTLEDPTGDPVIDINPTLGAILVYST